MNVPSSEPSDAVLEDVLARAVKFLAGVARTPAIFAALCTRGYSRDEQARGWSLVHAVAGYDLLGSGAAPADAHTPAEQAIVALDAWDEPNLRWIRSALENNAPDVASFVFEGGLAPATGAAAVLTVGRLLERLDALEHGTGARHGHARANHAALELLAKRGLTRAERTRLAELVATAQQAPAVPSAGAASASARTATEHRNAQLALYRWHADWASMAHTALTRREHRIRVGIAKRQSHKPHPAPPVATTEAPDAERVSSVQSAAGADAKAAGR